MKLPIDQCNRHPGKPILHHGFHPGCCPVCYRESCRRTGVAQVFFPRHTLHLGVVLDLDVVGGYLQYGSVLAAADHILGRVSRVYQQRRYLHRVERSTCTVVLDSYHELQLAGAPLLVEVLQDNTTRCAPAPQSPPNALTWAQQRGACSGAVQWLRKHHGWDLNEAYRRCPDFHWLVWALQRSPVVQEQQLRQVAQDFAERALEAQPEPLGHWRALLARVAGWRGVCIAVLTTAFYCRQLGGVTTAEEQAQIVRNRIPRLL